MGCVSSVDGAHAKPWGLRRRGRKTKVETKKRGLRGTVCRSSAHLIAVPEKETRWGRV